VNILVALIALVTVIPLPTTEFDQQCSNIALGCIKSTDANTNSCSVYIRASLRGQVRERTVEHEIRHCKGWHHL